MNTNIDLSQLKEKVNGNVVITAILIILAIVLGYVCWLTFEDGVALEARVSSEIVQYNHNRNFIKSLKDLKANSNYYVAQKEKYEEVIADNGTYNSVDYYVELSELCDRFGLTIKELTVGEMSAVGSVNSASTTLIVIGDEIDIKQMAEHIVSQQEIARIDSIAMTQQADGTVIASLVIVNFTK